MTTWICDIKTVDGAGNIRADLRRQIDAADAAIGVGREHRRHITHAGYAIRPVAGQSCTGTAQLPILDAAMRHLHRRTAR